MCLPPVLNDINTTNLASYVEVILRPRNSLLNEPLLRQGDGWVPITFGGEAPKYYPGRSPRYHASTSIWRGFISRSVPRIDPEGEVVVKANAFEKRVQSHDLLERYIKMVELIEGE